MRIGAVLMLVVALVLGGLSVFAARSWIERQVQGNAPKDEGMDVVKVVVARTQLNFGDKIKDEHLKQLNWPKASVPAGAFQDARQILDGDRPRVALRRIEANEPILKSKISGFGGRATLSAVLKGDRRAVTIRVNDVTGVAGFLLPGDRVDILLSRSRGKDNRVTSVLLQDIRVLGVGQIASERTDKPVVVRTVTVEATPEESQKLILAQQVGTLSMVLRPVTERTVISSRPVTLSDLTRDQTDAGRVNPQAEEPKPKTKTASKPAPRRKLSLPKRDPFATVGITRGLRRSTQRVPHEANSGTGMMPSAVTPPTSVQPGTGETEAPPPESGSTDPFMPSGSMMQSGAATDMPAGQQGQETTP